MRILGADLSLTSTGLALIENGRLIEVESFGTKGKRGDGYPEYYKRITKQTERARHVMSSWLYGFDLAVIEAPSFGSKYGNPFERAGLWWAIYNDLALPGVPIATVPPKTRAKYITGDGNADKATVLAFAIEQYVTEDSPRITNDDEADAVGLAVWVS